MATAFRGGPSTAFTRSSSDALRTRERARAWLGPDDLIRGAVQAAVEELPSRRMRRGPSRRVRATLRENVGSPFPGVVSAGRAGLRWHRRWSIHERCVGWGRICECSSGPDRRPGVARHTIRLVVGYDEATLEVTARGPWGALALDGLHGSIRAAARLDVD